MISCYLPSVFQCLISNVTAHSMRPLRSLFLFHFLSLINHIPAIILRRSAVTSHRLISVYCRMSRRMRRVVWDHSGPPFLFHFLSLTHMFLCQSLIPATGGLESNAGPVCLPVSDSFHSTDLMNSSLLPTEFSCG